LISPRRTIRPSERPVLKKGYLTGKATSCMYESRWYHDKGSTAPPRDQYWRRLISPVRPSFDILELRVLPRSMNRSGERPGLGKASLTSKAINFDVLELMVLPHRMACFTTYRSDSKTATLPSRDTILQSQALNHCKGLGIPWYISTGYPRRKGETSNGQGLGNTVNRPEAGKALKVP
jgi:hypothetical protein